MPYRTKAQARAVLANTSPSNPRHREARSQAKAKLGGGRLVRKKKGKNK